MKTLLLLSLVVGLAACGDDDVVIADMAVNVDAASDASAQPCTVIPSWNSTHVAAWGYPDPSPGLEFSTQIEADVYETATRFDYIFGAINTAAGAEQIVPRTVTIKGTTGNCQECMSLVRGYDSSIGNGGVFFLATKGTLKIEKADTVTGSGGIHLVGTNFEFQQADISTFSYLYGGQCIRVGSFDIEANYHNIPSTDGGLTDGGI